MTSSPIRTAWLPASICLGLLTATLPAQSPTLVKDINTTVSSSGGASPNYSRAYPKNVYDPTFLRKIPYIYFSATTIAAGDEPWMSAGTQASTVMLGDINPGPASSSPYGFQLTNDGKKLFFRATNPATGSELYVCDLSITPLKCTLVTDLSAGTNSSSPNYIAPIGTSSIVFYATTPATGYELFISDGTAAGTKLLKDIYPGTSSGSPRYMTPSIKGDKIFFYATDGTNGYEPWVTDGTPAGTVMIKDVRPGSSSSYPYRWQDLGNATTTKMITVMNDGTSGNELWMTDGTAAGTKLIKDSYPGTGSGAYLYYSVIHNGLLYYRGNDGTNGYEMWQTDGTAAGTKMVSNLHPTSSGYFYYPAVMGGKIYFQGNNGSSGNEIFVYDPVLKTTTLLKDIYAGSSSSSPSYLMSTINNKLFFQCNNGTNGYELWTSDGTAAGTQMVKDNYAGSSSGYAYYLTETVPGRVAYRSNDGQTGYNLWVSDGTAAGTSMIKIETSTVVKTNSASVSYIEEMNGKVYFSANDGVNGYELWSSDGTAAGTKMLKDINPGSSSGYGYYSTRLGNKIFFRGYTSTNGYEIWESDGTAAGTKMLKDIYPGSSSSYAQYMTRVGDKIYFQASTSATGYEPWVTDGTVAGTKMLVDLNPGSSSGYGQYFTALPSGKVLFYGYTSATGYELFETDGTAAGTKLVKDINPGSSSSYPRYLTAYKGKVYFSCNDGTNGYELWESDGTAAGTKIVLDTYAGSSSGYWYYLAEQGGLLYGYVYTPTNGYELWTTDGTKAGSKMVQDINPGSSSSSARYYSPIGSRHMYFRANTPATGDELFRYDGSTVKSWDINPGSNSSSPYNYTGNTYRFEPMNGALYFQANDGIKGSELYRMYNGATAQDIYPGASKLTLSGTDPVLAKSAAMTLTNPNASPVSVLLLGATNPNPVLLPGSTCPLFVDFSTLTVMGVSVLPTQTYNWAIPNDPMLVGANMLWQVVDIKKMPTFDTSNPLQWIIDNK